ncbi:MAG: thermonuclease family protein [Gammaproteobacteria bacterium]
MRISAVIRCGVVCCCLVLAAAHAGNARPGTVKKVFDGDTVELRSGERVRLLGIDAPESNSRNRQIPPQPFYLESRAALAALVDKKAVLLRVSKRLVGPYGRTLAYLHLPDGTDVQLEMLRGGHAMMTAYPPDLGHLRVYARAEAEAQKNRAGMWGDAYFSVQPLARGLPKKDGPVRVSGIVTSVSTGGRRIEIIVSESLKLQITHAAWHGFWRGADARQWAGKRVIAQGRIKSKSKTMRITHPVMLTIGAPGE